MTWIQGSNPPVETIDWNKRMDELPPGEISEELAREYLGGYLIQNLGLTAYMLTGYRLYPDQRIVLKGWMQKNFTLCIAGRGWSKSFLMQHFCYLFALMHAEQHILLVSATFRSSRRILEDIEKMAHRKRNGRYPGGELLKETIEHISKKPDVYTISFKNGSTIKAVPLGDPDNLRGFRCTVLVIDEGLLISQATIESVLKPFLTSDADLAKKQRVEIREDADIAAGKMTEQERRVFPSNSKMIILSSASYRWEELYTTYNTYLKLISPDPKEADGVTQSDGSVKQAPTRQETGDGAESSYLVQQLSYKVAARRMNKALLKEIEQKLIPENVIKREYEAQFIDESGGYFSAKEMNACTVPNGSLPCTEIVGEAGADYILGIDPSIASSDSADHFAMCVIKIITRQKEGQAPKKMGLVVHQYACCGVELKHHIEYLYYLLTKFKPVYVVCDTTQGDNMDFINVCNESEFFKTRRIELNAIQAEFTNESFDETVKQAKRSYNRDTSIRRIVQKQFFSSPVIRAGNEYMRACFDQRTLWFASKAQSVGDTVSLMSQQDVLNIHRNHPEYTDSMDEGRGNMHEFITYQDNMIERVKKECALIEVTPSITGNHSFDLPHSMTRNRKNHQRQRKDSYSALWLANWGLRIYLSMQETPDQVYEDLFTPRWI